MVKSRVVFSISIIATVLWSCASLSVNSLTIKAKTDGTNTPVVGVLTQEVHKTILQGYPGRNFTSYITASYVKFVEGSGARVVPIWIGRSEEYYKDIVSKVNGVLLPGGSLFFNQTDGYADAGYYVYKAAIELNEQGTYFPIWGTCLGLQLIAYLEANRTDVRIKCSSSKQALPLEFKEGYKTSRLFSNAPADILTILEKYRVTGNFHYYCLTQETFAEYGIDKNWNILSINHDRRNLEFISTIEHKKYPFYAIQFHPEKNLYEFGENRNIPHSTRAIRVGQYFANFFNNETRKNTNKFSDPKEIFDSLIYNYPMEYTARVNPSFTQMYLFEGTSGAASITATTANLNICGILSITAVWSLRKIYSSMIS